MSLHVPASSAQLHGADVAAECVLGQSSHPVPAEACACALANLMQVQTRDAPQSGVCDAQPDHVLQGIAEQALAADHRLPGALGPAHKHM